MEIKILEVLLVIIGSLGFSFVFRNYLRLTEVNTCIKYVNTLDIEWHERIYGIYDDSLNIKKRPLTLCLDILGRGIDLTKSEEDKILEIYDRHTRLNKKTTEELIGYITKLV